MFRKTMPAVLAAMICLCLFAAACGNSVPAANSNNETISVEIANNTENITIAFALFFGPDLDTWGANMLDEDVTIEPGKVLAIELPRSTYDLSLMTYENYVVKNVFSISEDVRVEIGGDDLAQLLFINESESDVYFFHISPTDSDDWGDEMLGEMGYIIAETGRRFFFVEPGVYDIRVGNKDNKVT